jgi:hypothetical protein
VINWPVHQICIDETASWRNFRAKQWLQLKKLAAKLDNKDEEKFSSKSDLNLIIKKAPQL